MTRGRFPAKALEAAMAIAEKRGLVRMYERGPGSIATFAIVHPGLLAEVRIKRLRSIGCSKERLERDAAGEIAGLKMFPSCTQISRELWGISQDYFIRFFRILENGILELGRDGEPLPAGNVVRPGQVPGPVRYLRRRKRELVAKGDSGTQPAEGTASRGSATPSKSPSDSSHAPGRMTCRTSERSVDSPYAPGRMTCRTSERSVDSPYAPGRMTCRTSERSVDSPYAPGQMTCRTSETDPDGSTPTP